MFKTHVENAIKKEIEGGDKRHNSRHIPKGRCSDKAVGDFIHP